MTALVNDRISARRKTSNMKMLLVTDAVLTQLVTEELTVGGRVEAVD